MRDVSTRTWGALLGVLIFGALVFQPGFARAQDATFLGDSSGPTVEDYLKETAATRSSSTKAIQDRRPDRQLRQAADGAEFQFRQLGRCLSGLYDPQHQEGQRALDRSEALCLLPRMRAPIRRARRDQGRPVRHPARREMGLVRRRGYGRHLHLHLDAEGQLGPSAGSAARCGPSATTTHSSSRAAPRSRRARRPRHRRAPSPRP